jgi:hypothetical protein
MLKPKDFKVKRVKLDLKGLKDRRERMEVSGIFLRHCLKFQN